MSWIFWNFETLCLILLYGIVINSFTRNYSLVVFPFSIHTSPKCLPSENPLWQQRWGRISTETRFWRVTFSKSVFCWYCCRIWVLFFQEIQWNYISIFSLLLLECRYMIYSLNAILIKIEILSSLTVLYFCIVSLVQGQCHVDLLLLFTVVIIFPICVLNWFWMKSRNCHTVSSQIVSHPSSCLC